LLRKAYGNETELIKRFRRYSRLRNGRELVEDDERGGRLKSNRAEVNNAAVADLVKNDRRIASKIIAEFFYIPKTVILRILKEDLKKRKSFLRLVPHSLVPEQGKIELHPASSLMRWPMQTNIFFNKIITGDETWCFACDSETKRQSSEWVGETSFRPKKLKF